MKDTIEIKPTGPVHGTIRPPGSKSLTNRALVCAALAKGVSKLHGVLDSDDTRIMVDCLGKLGVKIDADFESCKLEVHGCNGKFPNEKAELFVGNSGTTIRFLTAALSVAHGHYQLDGIPRMRERPIGDLVEALKQANIEISADRDNQFPPVEMKPNGLPGGTITIAGDASSQYLSGLLMAAPCAREDVKIEIRGELVSKPYVDMTIKVMESFGARVVVPLHGYETKAPQGYVGCEYEIEPDASAASYFWAAAAVTGGSVTVSHLNHLSLQGDMGFCVALRRMGCEVEMDERDTTVTAPVDGALHGIDIDMCHISDTVQTLGVVALFAKGATNIRNVAHIRHKETDRIGDLARELRKLGATVDERDDGLKITPGPFQPATIKTYDDHRMAMSFAVAGLRESGVVIADPGCTSKTYPNFFEDLAEICSSNG